MLLLFLLVLPCEKRSRGECSNKADNNAIKKTLNVRVSPSAAGKPTQRAISMTNGWRWTMSYAGSLLQNAHSGQRWTAANLREKRPIIWFGHEVISWSTKIDRYPFFSDKRCHINSPYRYHQQQLQLVGVPLHH